MSSEWNAKSVAEMAADLRAMVGKNAIAFQTPVASIRIDLAGRAHYDKALNKLIATPHMHLRLKSFGSNGRVNMREKITTPASKPDIRIARGLAKRKGMLR